MDVYLHIGLPKTGTTTIQSVLEARRGALLEEGVLFPGLRHHDQRLAAYDLLGQRVEGADVDTVAGSFARLTREINDHSGGRVVVSEEELGLARPRHVRRVVTSLSTHDIYVIVTVRDLARTIAAAWHQTVMMGDSCTWAEYLEAVRYPERGATSHGLAFWVRHDPLRVLDSWGTRVPVERTRVVTVPPPGSSSDVLLERFSGAADLPVGILRGERGRLNQSLGPAEVEVVRRLNEKLSGVLKARQHRYVIERGIRPRLPVRNAASWGVAGEHRDWIRERSEQIVEELQRRGHPVYGDLGDLLPADDDLPEVSMPAVSTEDLLAATEAALAALGVAHGQLFRRHRLAVEGQENRRSTPKDVVGSTIRATSFRLQKSTLRHADQNRLLAWALKRYLKRTSHGGRHG